MGYVLVTPPAIEPINLDEAKAHLREESNDSDALISTLIVAARQYAEGDTRRSFITQTWRTESFGFPGAVSFNALLTGHPSERATNINYLRLAHGPVQAITGITYIDENGVVQTLDPTNYVADLSRDIPRVYEAPFEYWPICLVQPGCVKVTYTVGYGAAAANVPQALRSAILMLLAHWYQNREAVTDGRINQPFEVPMACQRIFDMYRIQSFA